MSRIAPYAKAVASAVTAGLAWLVPAMGDGITTQEWAGTLLAALVGAGVTYAVPNRPRA